MLALLFAAAVAAASSAPPPVMIGKWDIGPDGEGSPSCVITLRSDVVIGGFGLTVPKACKGVLKRYDDLYAWYLNGPREAVFIDAVRKPVFRMTGDGQGSWSSPAGPDTYIMSKPGRPPTLAERMSGHWRLVALGGTPLCDFDMTSVPAGTAGKLKVRPGCKAPWSGRAISAWVLNGRRITLNDTAGKPVVVISDCGLGGCDGELPNGDFVGFTPIFE